MCVYIYICIYIYTSKLHIFVCTLILYIYKKNIYTYTVQCVYIYIHIYYITHVYIAYMFFCCGPLSHHGLKIGSHKNSTKGLTEKHMDDEFQ